MERHRLDVLSLLFGLFFTAVALIGLSDVITLYRIDVRWIGPGLLVVFGIALVLTAARGDGNGRARTAGDRTGIASGERTGIAPGDRTWSAAGDVDQGPDPTDDVRADEPALDRDRHDDTVDAPEEP